MGYQCAAAIIIVLLGATMTSAIGMIAGAAGRGFAMTLFYGVVIMIPLMFPVSSILHNGTPSLFIQTIPSYGIMKGLVGATVYGQGVAELAPYIYMALAWDIVLLGLGLVILKKRVETL